MLKKTVLGIVAASMLVIALPRPFFAQSAPGCEIGHTCSMSIDLPNCVSAQVDFNVPAGSFEGYWNTIDGDEADSAWDGTCDGDSCDETDYFNGNFDGQGTTAVSYTVEWTNQGGQPAVFYDAFCSDAAVSSQQHH